MKIRDFESFSKKYKSLVGIGNCHHRHYIYKYMSFNTAIKVLKTNTLRFSKPTQWKDPFESRFLNADYSKVDRTKELNNHLVACCLTGQTANEAAWRMYSDYGHGEHCVQFSIYIGQLRLFLDKYATEEGLKLYEGSVDYSFKDAEIERFICLALLFIRIFFEKFTNLSFLNLMLIKRQAFEYENEIRYILQDPKAHYYKKYLDVSIPWSIVLNNVKIDPESNQDEIEELNNALQKNRNVCRRDYPNYNTSVISPQKHIIFKEHEPIIIGER